MFQPCFWMDGDDNEYNVDEVDITEVLIDGCGDVDENEVDNENDNSR